MKIWVVIAAAAYLNAGMFYTWRFHIDDEPVIFWTAWLLWWACLIRRIIGEHDREE